MSVAQAMPVMASRDEIATPDQKAPVNTGEPPTERTIFIMIALSSTALLCFFLGFRWNKLKHNVFTKRNVISTLVLIIFIHVNLFIVVTTVLIAGQGLYTFELCKAVTWVCLVFYSFTKFAILVFLVERVHIVRAPFMKRRKDKIYLACMVMVFVGYVPLIAKFYNPLKRMDANGRCRAGIPPDSIIPTIAVSAVVDLILTGVFFFLLRPAFKLRRQASATEVLSGRRDKGTRIGETARETSAQRSIRILLWKSIIGSVLIILPMMANMIQMAVTKGQEYGMICLSICVVEVVWDAMVIYWLTFGSSSQAEKDLSKANANANVSLPQSLSTTSTRKDSIEIGKLEAAHTVHERPAP